MSTVVGIEVALRELPISDARAIADWLQGYLDDRWDRQIDDDIDAGRLDVVAERSLRDYEAVRARPLDEVLDKP